MPGDLDGPRSFFLGGGAGDDVQLSESTGSPESDLERFSPLNFGGRLSADVGDGNTEALGVGRSAGVSTGSDRHGDIQLRCHSLEILVLALQILIFLFKLFPLCLDAEDLRPSNFRDTINDGRVEMGAALPHFAVSA